jgi:NTE family protein
MNIIHLVYRSKDADSQAKDYEFSVASKDMHWSAGYTDTRRTLRHRDWLEPPPTHVGVVTHDLLLDSDD